MERFIKRYRGKGFKLTPQRLAILHYLEGNEAHPTAEDIYRELRKTHPTVSFATVYNTVQALVGRGELLEITIDPERKHFDPNATPHHHIMCTRCRRIDDIFIDYSDVLKPPENVSGKYHITGNHVDFYGVCRKCTI